MTQPIVPKKNWVAAALREDIRVISKRHDLDPHMRAILGIKLGWAAETIEKLESLVRDWMKAYLNCPATNCRHNEVEHECANRARNLDLGLEVEG